MIKNKKSGFTFIEVIVSIFVIAIIVSLAIASFSSFRENQTLVNETDKIVSLIGEARSKTISSQDFSQYGIHFEASTTILFKGTSYSAGDPNNTTHPLASLVETYSIVLNGGVSDLVFQRLSGKTDQFGTIGIRVKSDTSKTKTITINSTGIIDVQ